MYHSSAKKHNSFLLRGFVPFDVETGERLSTEAVRENNALAACTEKPHISLPENRKHNLFRIFGSINLGETSSVIAPPQC